MSGAERNDSDAPSARPEEDGLDTREYSLMEHLGDLRMRLMRASIGVFVVSIGAFVVSADVLELLKRPMVLAAERLGTKPHFIVIAPAEYFIAQLKAAVVVGIFLSMPWTLYQLWLFVAPGLYRKERRYVQVFVWAGAFFFLAGGAFAYFLAFPGMFKFFLEHTMKAGVDMQLSVAEHFGFSMKLLLAFGLTFQAPVVVFVLSMAGIVDPHKLGKYRGIIVVVAFVIGAVLTPPDVLSQMMLAGPLVLLFELGLWVSKVSLKLRKKREQRSATLTTT